MLAFYATNFVFWLGLGVIWKKNDRLNLALKFAMFLMAAWACFYVYEAVLALTEDK